MVQRTTTAPYQANYLDQVFSEAQRMYEGGQLAPNPFLGQRVVPMSEQRSDALQMQEDLARGGNPFTEAQTGGLVSTLRGDFLLPESNPFLRATFDQAAGAVSDAVASQFASGGRYGSGAMANTLGRNLNELATSIYAPAYEAERDRMLDANRYVDIANQMRFDDAARLALTGQERENQMQRELNQRINLFNELQAQPIDALGRYASLLSGNFGGTSKLANELSTTEKILLGLGAASSIADLGNKGMTVGGIAGDIATGIGNFVRI